MKHLEISFKFLMETILILNPPNGSECLQKFIPSIIISKYQERLWQWIMLFIILLFITTNEVKFGENQT